MKFNYCQSQIEEGNKCKQQCEHCREYYAPLEKSLKQSKMKKEKLIGTLVVLIFVVLPFILTIFYLYKIYEQTQYEVPKKEPTTYKVFYSDSTKGFVSETSPVRIWHREVYDSVGPNEWKKRVPFNHDSDSAHQAIISINPFNH